MVGSLQFVTIRTKKAIVNVSHQKLYRCPVTITYADVEKELLIKNNPMKIIFNGYTEEEFRIFRAFSSKKHASNIIL